MINFLFSLNQILPPTTEAQISLAPPSTLPTTLYLFLNRKKKVTAAPSPQPKQNLKKIPFRFYYIRIVNPMIGGQMREKRLCVCMCEKRKTITSVPSLRHNFHTQNLNRNNLLKCFCNNKLYFCRFFGNSGNSENGKEVNSKRF